MKLGVPFVFVFVFFLFAGFCAADEQAEYLQGAAIISKGVFSSPPMFVYACVDKAGFFRHTQALSNARAIVMGVQGTISHLGTIPVDPESNSWSPYRGLFVIKNQGGYYYREALATLYVPSDKEGCYNTAGNTLRLELSVPVLLPEPAPAPGSDTPLFLHMHVVRTRQFMPDLLDTPIKLPALVTYTGIKPEYMKDNGYADIAYCDEQGSSTTLLVVCTLFPLHEKIEGVVTRTAAIASACKSEHSKSADEEGSESTDEDGSKSTDEEGSKSTDKEGGKDIYIRMKRIPETQDWSPKFGTPGKEIAKYSCSFSPLPGAQTRTPIRAKAGHGYGYGYGYTQKRGDGGPQKVHRLNSRAKWFTRPNPDFSLPPYPVRPSSSIHKDKGKKDGKRVSAPFSRWIQSRSASTFDDRKKTHRTFAWPWAKSYHSAGDDEMMKMTPDERDMQMVMIETGTVHIITPRETSPEDKSQIRHDRRQTTESDLRLDTIDLHRPPLKLNPDPTRPLVASDLAQLKKAKGFGLEDVVWAD